MDRDILIYFGKKIKKLRKDINISQEELANICELHRTYIGMIERGEKNITLINIAKIAKALNIKISKLMDFYNVFKVVLEGTEYEIKKKPQDFNSIYLDVELDKKELSEIYNPKEKIKRHGFIPDFVIINNNTGKSIYIEVKRQDWLG